MTVLVCANSSSSYTYRIVRDFCERGHTVYLLSNGLYTNLPYPPQAQTIQFLRLLTRLFEKIFPGKMSTYNAETATMAHPVSWLGLIRHLYLIVFVNTVVKHLQFDTVFSTNLAFGGLYAGRINRNVPKVCQTLGTELVLYPFFSLNRIFCAHFILRYVIRKHNSVLTGMGEFYKNIFRSLKADSANIVYYGMFGVDGALFNMKSRSVEKRFRLFGLDENTILAVCFRQPRPLLDFEGLITNLGEIVKQYPSFYFAIGTGGVNVEDLRQLAINMGIEKNILFLNHVEYDQLHEYLAQGDIYLDPVNAKKYPEAAVYGTSGSVIEAMACGNIPILNDRPDIYNYLPNEALQFVFKDQDKELKEKLLLAVKNVNNFALRSKISNHVLITRSWSVYINTILSLLANNKDSKEK